MKRKYLLLLAAFMLLSVVFAPAAYAANNEYSSIRRYGNEFTIGPDDVPLIEFPTAEIVKEFTAADGGSAVIAVGSDAVLEAVEAVVSGEAVRIAVIAAAPDAENDSAAVNTLSISMPGDALAAVAQRTDADLQIATDIGQMILPNSVIASIVEQAGGEDITFIMAREPLDDHSGGSVTEVDILCDGQSITSWDGGAVILKLSVGVGDFEPDLSYRVIQTSADNTSNEHAGLCVENGSDLYVEVSITHLSAFTVLTETAKEAAHTPRNFMVQSPLAAGIDAGDNGGIPYIWIAACGLVFATCAVGAAVLRRRRNG